MVGQVCTNSTGCDFGHQDVQNQGRTIEGQEGHPAEPPALNADDLRGSTGWDAGYATKWPMEAAQGSGCYTQRAEPDVRPC